MIAPSVVLGLLSLCSLSLSQECNQQLQENMDFPGTDITSVYSPDVEHCQLMCTQYPACLFFTFIRPDWTRDSRHFYCYLKSTPSGRPNIETPLLGVTSGYSLESCGSNQPPCLPKVYQNTDFPGADYKALFTADYEECQRACTHDPGCHFFTFVNELFTTERIRYKCHLKFSWTVPRTFIIHRTAGITSGFSHGAATEEADCKAKIITNTDIPGFNFEELISPSAEHCQSLCSAHPSCTYFSYSGQSFKCQLKKGGDTMVTVAKNGVTSGLPTRFCQPDNSWVKVPFQGLDFHRSDIRYELKDDLDTCQRACTDDPHCQFYTYLNETFWDSDLWRRCYLKRVITMPAPPKVTKLANVVSGFAKRNCDTVTRV